MKTVYVLMASLLIVLPAYAETSREWWQRQNREYRDWALRQQEVHPQNGGSDAVNDAFGFAILALLGVAIASQHSNPSPPARTEKPKDREQEPPTRVALRFLERYHEAASNDVEHQARFFADRVYWYDKGLVTKAKIIREKQAVERICPVRNYDIHEDTIQVFNSDLGNGFFDIRYRVTAYCSGGRRQTAQLWSNLITVDASSSKAEIVAVFGRRVGS